MCRRARPERACARRSGRSRSRPSGMAWTWAHCGHGCSGTARHRRAHSGIENAATWENGAPPGTTRHRPARLRATCNRAVRGSSPLTGSGRSPFDRVDQPRAAPPARSSASPAATKPPATSAHPHGPHCCRWPGWSWCRGPHFRVGCRRARLRRGGDLVFGGSAGYTVAGTQRGRVPILGATGACINAEHRPRCRAPHR